MEQIIKADLHRYVPGSYSFWKFMQGLRTQGFRYMYFHRKCNLYSKYNPLRFFYWIFKRHYMYKYGFQIACQIDEGFYIGHFGTIVTSRDAIIGKNCNISHGVTIGVTRRGEKKGDPAIGDEVWIGAGAVIVGNVKIGNNVLIAPNSYVNFDVPDNSIVIGNPGIIKASVYATQGYINNKYLD